MSNTGLLGLLAEKMGYLNQRQSVIAENVANANAPGYKALDLEPFSFGAAVNDASKFGMQVDDPRHIVPPSMAGVNSKTKETKSFETLPTGNSVDLEQQMMQVSETAVNYQMAAGIYKQVSGWFRIAVKGS